MHLWARAPLHPSPSEGLHTAYKPQEAFCHLPELQKAREAALSALGESPHETQTPRLTGHSALPSSSSEVAMLSLSSQHLSPVGVGVVGLGFQ